VPLFSCPSLRRAAPSVLKKAEGYFGQAAFKVMTSHKAEGNAMDVAYISALSALAGSVVGGFTSGLITWMALFAGASGTAPL